MSHAASSPAAAVTRAEPSAMPKMARSAIPRRAVWAEVVPTLTRGVWSTVAEVVPSPPVLNVTPMKAAKAMNSTTTKETMIKATAGASRSLEMGTVPMTPRPTMTGKIVAVSTVATFTIPKRTAPGAMAEPPMPAPTA